MLESGGEGNNQTVKLVVNTRYSLNFLPKEKILTNLGILIMTIFGGVNKTKLEITHKLICINLVNEYVFDKKKYRENLFVVLIGFCDFPWFFLFLLLYPWPNGNLLLVFYREKIQFDFNRNA
jgi:hypothetical protein